MDADQPGLFQLPDHEPQVPPRPPQRGKNRQVWELTATAEVTITDPSALQAAARSDEGFVITVPAADLGVEEAEPEEADAAPGDDVFDALAWLIWPSDGLEEALDAGALRREVLDAAAADPPTYLPSLRDPKANRSTRVAPVPAPDGLVLIISGSLLLRHDLPFDRTVHLALSPAARARRTSRDDAWTLPAYDRYDAETQPAEAADVVLKLDDPRRPALRWT